MHRILRSPSTPHRWLLAVAFVLTTAIYWPGLYGSFLFDDYPNIVDNHGVQPINAGLASLVGAALSSPSSEFKRPLASLSFAVNYLITGLDPYWMKLTNLVIHLLNGLLVFLLARALLRSPPVGAHLVRESLPSKFDEVPSRTGCAPKTESRIDTVAALIAASWMLLPINLTAVLYIVQRMESMANLFVLLGLLGYLAGRRRMLETSSGSPTQPRWTVWAAVRNRHILLCLISITVPTALGILAKETAVMLPLYALLIEWILFKFKTSAGKLDRRIVSLFVVLLAIPMAVGLAWLLPNIVHPETWAARDFTLDTRLLSEARIVVDYIRWTLLPTPDALSFYHDNFHISHGLLTPWSTLVCIVLLAILVGLILWLRARQPLVALGLALFLGCQLLTGTILPLELIYEHRNYFASFGLMLAVVPLLAVPRTSSFALPRYALLGGLMVCWTALTGLTAYEWGNPMRLAQDLATRAPNSPRAQYELGRTYIIYSHYDPISPFTQLAYAPLEKSAALPDSSILPEQALIFMNSRMHLPLKDAWWDSMISKLNLNKPGVQDESSLEALTKCMREGDCKLPRQRMTAAYFAALSHNDPSARLLAMYGDYAWNIIDDHHLGLRMTEAAVKASPNESAYQVTLVRMFAAEGEPAEAASALRQLQRLNIGGRLDSSLDGLRKLPGLR